MKTAEEIDLVRPRSAEKNEERPAVPRNLFQDLDGLTMAMLTVLAESATEKAASRQAERWLDSFLFVAGINQIAEDYLHRDIGSLRQVARHVRGSGSVVGAMAASTLRCTSRLLGAVLSVVGDRAVGAWYRELADLAQCLADTYAAPGGLGDLDVLARRLVTRAQRLPLALRRTILRLPACFTTFDQHPLDCQRLAQAFADRWPDRKRPLTVVGVRTSGSYLAPLCTAYLKGLGFQKVEALTWRSGQRWFPTERRRLKGVAKAGGLALIVDDPPTSGNTLAEAADQVKRLGMPAESIILGFQAFDAPSWWPWSRRLEAYQRIILPWERWTIQNHLHPDSVEQALNDLLVGRQIRVSSPGHAALMIGAVKRVERMPFAPRAEVKVRRSSRGHVRARFRVHVEEEGTGREVEHDVYVKGTGLGYFGEQSLAVARKLDEFVPEVYGTRNGLMFREWLPEGRRLCARVTNRSVIAEGVSSYVAARHTRLRVSEDLSQRLVGRDTHWEQSARLLTQPFGRLAAAVRVLLRPTFKHLLRASQPSLVDGTPTPSQWFLDGKRLLKVDFDENVFWKATPGTYDPVADLAGAAVHFPPGRDDGALDRKFGRELREMYGALTGEHITAERWFLHQLVNLRKCQERFFYDYNLSQDAQTLHGLLQAIGPLDRDHSRLFEHYFGDLFLGDTLPRAAGPFCALDIDGVLETPWLSFSTITPAGALALRALARHGYRTLLATGRCLDEVRERCAAYRLPGGVGEYGAVIYNHLGGSAHGLLSPDQQSVLDTLRRVLLSAEGVHVDPSHRYSVRAYRIVDARRSGLEPDTIQGALAHSEARDEIRVVRGKAQTDFVIAGIDKGFGLEALTTELGRMVTIRSDARVLTFAVGDTEADSSMFPLAEQSFAPANADASLRQAAGAGDLKITKRRHQAGLLEAVSRVIGHPPGSCAACRPPRLSPDGAFLMKILGTQDVGRPGKIGQVLALAARQNALGSQ